jgi:hypothetical protein
LPSSDQTVNCLPFGEIRGIEYSAGGVFKGFRVPVPSTRTLPRSGDPGHARMHLHRGLVCRRSSQMRTCSVPDGQRRVPDGQRRIPNGQRRVPNGKRHVPNGQRRIPNGQRRVPNGKRHVPNGKRHVPDGQTPVSDGKTRMPNGKTRVHPRFRARFT